ncbi:DiGeorge syndrome critical region protein 14 [Gaertneriomyces sp. JEL0708]|nr:DiGeorge syndrome critical region protein 14 [Gaertneriomyces sp. JEL0708]
MPTTSTTTTTVHSTSGALTTTTTTQPTQNKKRMQQVLPEDVYVDTLSAIVERDFFPSLKKMKLQNAILEGNVHVYPSASQTPIARGQSPTPSESISVRDIGGEEPKVDVDDSLTLDKFQSRYANEDDISFGEILENVERQRREKYQWIFESESNAQNKLLRLENGQSSSGSQLLLEDSKDRQKKGVVEGWKYKAKNALLYYPSTDSEAQSDLPLVHTTSKILNHDATRFNDSTLELASELLEQQQRMNTQRIFTEIGLSTPSASSGTPQVNGYKYVPTTPLLRPDEDVDPSELMTWGVVEGTPLLVSGASHNSGATASSTKGFKIPDTPRREQLAMRMADRARSRLRNKSGAHQRRVPGTPTNNVPPSPSGWSSGSVASSPLPGRGWSAAYSPAARKLLEKARTKPGDDMLRASYSRTPVRSRGGAASSTPGSTNVFTPLDVRKRGVATPLVSQRKGGETVQHQGKEQVKMNKSDRSSLTDGLLEL